ncbi:tonB-dependent Receptor Plug domain protein, partial [Yersinia pestis PY-60]|jgi:hypothetical protein
MAKV